MPEAYELVTRENYLDTIAERLKNKRGRVLSSGKFWGVHEGFSIWLYGQGNIMSDLGEPWITSKSHHPLNREYDLRYRHPKQNKEKQSSWDDDWDSALSLFEKLKFGNWEFEISGNSIIGTGLFHEGRTIYVSNKKGDMRKALTDLITEQTVRIRQSTQYEFPINEQEINQMVEYSLKDLETGEIMKHNTRAGQEADAAVGLASF